LKHNKTSIEKELSLKCSFFEIEKNVKIENLFLLEKALIVVSKTSIYETNINDCPEEILIKRIFNNKENGRTEKVIKDIEMKHNSLYMMIRNDSDEETTFCKFSLEKNKKMIFCHLLMKVNRFEISYKDEFTIFLISKRKVFQYKLQGAMKSFKMHIRSKFFKNVNKIQQNYKISGRLKKIYSNRINKINFFKFDKKMKYFFTHDDKLIKKCLFKTGEDVFTFFDKRARVRYVWFTKNLSIMIT
jgi:stress-induced morphogen